MGKCYSINRRLPNPLQLHMTSFEGRFDKVFPSDDIVYLSSDSENVLTDLEENKVYIIGALVDHNHNKGICHSKATEAGVATARLPIDEFISMKTRKVLTINHVYEILASVTQGKSWKEAFLEVIPDRKGIMVKESSGDSDRDGQTCDGEEETCDKASGNSSDITEDISLNGGDNGESGDVAL